MQQRPLGVGVPVLGDFIAVAGEGVDDAVAHRQHRLVVALEEAFLVAEGNAAHVPVEIERDVGLLGRDVAEPDRLVEPHGAGQVVRLGHHGGEPIGRGEGRDPPAAAAVQGPDEAALVLAGHDGIRAPAAERHGGAPGALESDFGVVGARGSERVV